MDWAESELATSKILLGSRISVEQFHFNAIRETYSDASYLEEFPDYSMTHAILQILQETLGTGNQDVRTIRPVGIGLGSTCC